MKTSLLEWKRKVVPIYLTENTRKKITILCLHWLSSKKVSIIGNLTTQGLPTYNIIYQPSEAHGYPPLRTGNTGYPVPSVLPPPIHRRQHLALYDLMAVTVVGKVKMETGSNKIRFEESLVLLRTETKPIPTILSSLYTREKNSGLTFKNSDFDT